MDAPPKEFSENTVAPTWPQDLRNWLENRFQDPSLAAISSNSYKEHLFKEVLRVRSQVLAEAEFASLCRVSAWSLLLRTHIFIAGAQHNRSLDETFAAMFAVLPEYPSFYTKQDFYSGGLSANLISKAQLVEAEMFSVFVRDLSNTPDWFDRANEETEKLAEKYWDQSEQKSLPASQPSKSAPLSAKQPTKPKGGLWYGALILLSIVWFWNSDFVSSSPNRSEALGYNLASFGLPLILLLFAVSRFRVGAHRITQAPGSLSTCVVCGSVLVMALYDLLTPSSNHHLGAFVLAVAFGIFTTIFAALAYRARRSSTSAQIA